MWSFLILLRRTTYPTSSIPSFSQQSSNLAGNSADLTLAPVSPPVVHRDSPRLPPEAPRTNPTPACFPASTCHVHIALHTSYGFSLLHQVIGFGANLMSLCVLSTDILLRWSPTMYSDSIDNSSARFEPGTSPYGDAPGSMGPQYGPERRSAPDLSIQSCNGPVHQISAPQLYQRSG